MEQRVIKFRAWDKQNNEMVEPDAFFIFTGSEVLMLNPHHVDNNYYQIDSCEDRFIQIQFTGLADKNGKEIYEGDIVRILYTDWASKDDSDTRTIDQYKRDISSIGAIVCANINWYVDGVGTMDHGTHGEIEVIGNIYKNPELIKQH